MNILKKIVKYYPIYLRNLFMRELIFKEFHSFYIEFSEDKEKAINDGLIKLNDVKFIFNFIKCEFNEKKL